MYFTHNTKDCIVIGKQCFWRHRRNVKTVNGIKVNANIGFIKIFCIIYLHKKLINIFCVHQIYGFLFWKRSIAFLINIAICLYFYIFLKAFEMLLVHIVIFPQSFLGNRRYLTCLHHFMYICFRIYYTQAATLQWRHPFSWLLQ